METSLLATSVAFDAVVRLGTFLACAGAGWLLCHRVLKDRLAARRIQPQRLAPTQAQHDLRWGLAAGATFLVLFALAAALAGAGVTRLYTNVDDYGWAWLVLSPIVMTLVHDAYFYWTHRLLHHKRLFGKFHRQHHHGRSPTPWSTFALHPVEAAVHFGILFVFLFALPVHVYVLLGWTAFMTAVNVLGHLGFELLPLARMQRDPFWRWVYGTSHHDRHHERSQGNYAFYMTVWDKAFGTLDEPRGTAKPE